MSEQKSSVSQAVRSLRVSLGESQQAFAYRMKTAVRTIARWETVRPPQGKFLAGLSLIAMTNGLDELGLFFYKEALGEIGKRIDPQRIREDYGLSSVVCRSAMRLRELEAVLVDTHSDPQVRLIQAIAEVKDIRVEIEKFLES